MTLRGQEFFRCEGLGAGHREKLGGTISNGISSYEGATYAVAARTSPLGARWRGLRRTRRVLGDNGQGNGRWHGGQLEVTQEARDHRFLGDGGNDPQGATAAQRTGGYASLSHQRRGG